MQNIDNLATVISARRAVEAAENALLDNYLAMARLEGKRRQVGPKAALRQLRVASERLTKAQRLVKASIRKLTQEDK